MSNKLGNFSIPTVYDEPFSSLFNVLNLSSSRDASDQEVLTGGSLPQLFSHVYGGQVIAQAILAAATKASPSRVANPHSIHVNFMRAGDTQKSIFFNVSCLHRGRSFESFQVIASQEEKELMTLLVSFQEVQPGPTYEVTNPQVSPPNGIVSNLDIFRLVDNPVAKFLGRTSCFEVRHVDGDLYTTTRRPGPHRVWIKPRVCLPEISQIVSRALLAYVVDQLISEPLLRSLGLCWTTPGLALASLDHAMWFHHDVNINDWHLIDLSCAFAGGSRGLSQGKIYNSEGTLVSSLAQEAMVRIADNAGKWAFDGKGIEIKSS
ncbi:thioesterase family protein [Actinomycetaceae bacterium TAE3-ERU4]|nr:thioesterase family protein [Actinomycetaceae bacterium TAE3-ERU4]